MTLREQIGDEVAAVFLDTDEFAQSVEHWPLGREADKATISAVVDLDMEGSSSGIDDADGSRIVRAGELELASTVVVTCNERGNQRDLFLIDGELWTAVRVLGRDGIPGMQTVAIERAEGVTTKRTRV